MHSTGVKASRRFSRWSLPAGLGVCLYTHTHAHTQTRRSHMSAFSKYLETALTHQAKSTSKTHVIQGARGDKGRIKQRSWYARKSFRSQPLPPDPTGRHTGWAVRRFDSRVLSEVPGVVFACSCSQGPGRRRIASSAACAIRSTASLAHGAWWGHKYLTREPIFQFLATWAQKQS